MNFEYREKHIYSSNCICVAVYCLLVLCIVCSGRVLAASFDCKKTTVPVEKMICADPRLSKLDVALQLAWNEALTWTTMNSDLKISQVKWITNRNLCKDPDCLIQSYTARIKLLGQVADGEPEPYFKTSLLQNSQSEFVIWDGIPLHKSCDKNQRTINGCADEVWRKVDKRLNYIYELQLTYLKNDKSKSNFIEAQNAWMKFRDIDCKYQSDFDGAMSEFEQKKCFYKRTVNRIKELKEYAACRFNGCPS
jgi:uncharacterized protein YecT (DUF1311 family)